MPACLQVLLEFKEYAQEVDVEFVRKVRGLAGRGPGLGPGLIRHSPARVT